MLKLEKSPDLSDICIRLREKEPFFEKRFIQALTLAIFIHGIAFFLFRAAPFTLLTTFTFPPIEVRSDKPLKIQLEFSPHLQGEDDLAPPYPPLFPARERDLIPPSSPLLSSSRQNLQLFQPLENQWQPHLQLPLPIDLQEHTFQLEISGDLAEYSLKNTPSILNEMRIYSPERKKALTSTFFVQMDEKRGEIFWIEKTNSSANAEHDRLMEKLIFQLQFIRKEKSELAFVSGFVSLITRVEQ